MTRLTDTNDIHDPENLGHLSRDESGEGLFYAICSAITTKDGDREIEIIKHIDAIDYQSFYDNRSLFFSPLPFKRICDDVYADFELHQKVLGSIASEKPYPSSELGSTIERNISSLIQNISFFETKLKEEYGRGTSVAFKNDTNLLYESTESYAVLNKLRNVVQHGHHLPLHFDDSISDDGKKSRKFYLDSNCILKSCNTYLNGKVKAILHDNPELPILSYITQAYIVVLKMMRWYIDNVVISKEVVNATTLLLKEMLSLNSSYETYSLCKGSLNDDDSIRGLDYLGLPISITEACKLLSNYLQTSRLSIFVYTGNSISENLLSLMPRTLFINNPIDHLELQSILCTSLIYKLKNQRTDIVNGDVMGQYCYLEHNEIFGDSCTFQWNSYKLLFDALKRLSLNNTNDYQDNNGRSQDYSRTAGTSDSTSFS